MHSADGRYTIVFNGEIYNYQNCAAIWRRKARLPDDGHTEVLLQMYAEYGEDMLVRLAACMRLAYGRAGAGAFLARDPFGIKPLYYAEARPFLFRLPGESAGDGRM